MTIQECLECLDRLRCGEPHGGGFGSCHCCANDDVDAVQAEIERLQMLLTATPVKTAVACDVVDAGKEVMTGREPTVLERLEALQRAYGDLETAYKHVEADRHRLTTKLATSRHETAVAKAEAASLVEACFNGDAKMEAEIARLKATLATIAAQGFNVATDLARKVLTTKDGSHD